MFSVSEGLFKAATMTSANKCKGSGFRKSLSLGERIDVIKEHERTPSSRELAIMFGCSLTQIKNILRRKSEFLEEWHNNGNLARLKRRQSARFLTVGVIICEWYYRCKRSRRIVTDEIILAMGKQVSEKLKMTELRPGNNWLERMRQKFKMSDEELQDICMPRYDIEESLEMDDIIQDLRSSCPDRNMPAACLAFPYELTRVYLKDSPDEAHDISKARMRNCLREAKGDKFMQVDGIWTQNAQHDKNINEEDLSFIYCNDGNVPVKTEIIEFSLDSPLTVSDDTESSSCGMYNEEIYMQAEAPKIAITEQALTRGISSYREAYNILGPMEQFALVREDIRAVGLINQLENHYKDMMLSGNK